MWFNDTKPKFEKMSTYADTVVPECYVVLLPLKTDMNLLSSGNDFIEILDNRVTFRFRDSHNACDKTRIEKQRLPASDGMSAD